MCRIGDDHIEATENIVKFATEIEIRRFQDDMVHQSDKMKTWVQTISEAVQGI